MRLHVETTISSPPPAVWAHLEDIASHVEWMADAVDIDFLTTERQGAGTRFACRTRVGPLRTTDIMEITEWSPPRVMGVRHRGAVSGEGRFELATAGQAGESTTMVWAESLRFPWWLGGPLGARLARPVFRRIWRGNLARLKNRVESAADR
ncbi:MAG: SRPBCC family protein [bacterium]|nr:SRPBCC family protein [bacterium]